MRISDWSSDVCSSDLKIEHVESAHQLFRKGGVLEYGNDATVVIMHIDHCLWIAETDDNATFALFAAPEVDIADVAAARNGRLSARVRRRGDGRIFDFDVQLVAITSQRIRRGSAHCDHDPRTTIRFAGIDGGHISNADHVSRL